jgi:hypothetical protein
MASSSKARKPSTKAKSELSKSRTSKLEKAKVIKIDHTKSLKKAKSKGLKADKSDKQQQRQVKASQKVKAKKREIQDAMDTLVIPRVASTDEQRFLEDYSDMLTMTANIIRKLDEAISADKRPGSRDLYALSAIMSQHREIISDIRTMTDMSSQVEQLIVAALQPMTTQLGQNLIDAFYQIKALIVDVAKPAETQSAIKKLDRIFTDQGRFIQDQHTRTVEKVQEILLGPKEQPQRNKKRRK